MVDLVFRDVKPRPVRIQIGRHSQRRLEPRIIVLCELRERHLPCLLKIVDIERQVASANLTPAIVVKL